MEECLWEHKEEEKRTRLRTMTRTRNPVPKMVILDLFSWDEMATLGCKGIKVNQVDLCDKVIDLRALVCVFTTFGIRATSQGLIVRRRSCSFFFKE